MPLEFSARNTPLSPPSLFAGTPKTLITHIQKCIRLYLLYTAIYIHTYIIHTYYIVYYLQCIIYKFLLFSTRAHFPDVFQDSLTPASPSEGPDEAEIAKAPPLVPFEARGRIEKTNIWAFIITYTILGVPYYNYSMMGPKGTTHGTIKVMHYSEF